MAENSGIEWTTHTFNPWRGCTKVSPGCEFCYAEATSKRNPKVLGEWGPKGTRVIASESYWKQPEKWDREAKEAAVRRRVFCASLADVFEGPESMTGEGFAVVKAARARLFDLIAETPHLDWLLLTKRPENWETCLAGVVSNSSEEGGVMASHWLDGEPPKNVWLGVSVEDEAMADERIPTLVDIPAAVRFLSCEPLLEEVNLEGSGAWGSCVPVSTPWKEHGWEPTIHWVIAGGESGSSSARPMHPAWARAIRDECQDAGVPFFFKQWGEWIGMDDYSPFVHGENNDKYEHRFLYSDGTDHPCSSKESLPTSMFRVGKKKAGAMLDGREWREFPNA